MNIQLKRVYDSPAEDDGYRILIDRLWPRGIKKEEARLDEWNKDLAPSDALRKWFQHERERFDEFSRRYQEELSHQKEPLTHLKKMSKTKKVTLLYAAKDRDINNAVVLYEVLERLKA